MGRAAAIGKLTLSGFSLHRFFLLAQDHEIIHDDAGHFAADAVLVFVFVVGQLTADSYLLALLANGAHHFGQLPPGDAAVPFGGLDLFSVRVAVVIIGGQRDIGDHVAIFGFGEFRVFAQVSDQSDSVLEVAHDSRFFKEVKEYPARRRAPDAGNT